MNALRTIMLSLLACILLVSCTGNQTKTGNFGPLASRMTSLGEALTDPKGMTLYTYKDDPSGGSTCSGRCARKWLPMEAAPDAKPNGKLSIIERKDGIRQYAYNGRALYRWVKDKSPGDVTGHNKGEVWFLARP